MTNVRSVLRLAGCVGLLSATSFFGCSSGEVSDGENESVAQIYEPATPADANFSDSVFVSISDGAGMTFAPDGRLFVSQKTGQLRVVKNGQLLSTPFLTVPVATENERGLYAVVFDPQFASNNYLYVFYTSVAGGIHSRLSRFTANGDIAVPGSELVLIDFPLSSADMHNGGAMMFGKDGKLYVTVGDQAITTNPQSLTTPLGKILRINSDGTIPTDNPFYATTTGINRAIWALGLRNPFTAAIQPGTGTIFVNDVGNGAWEEINRASAGANFGWPTTEGDFDPTVPANAGFTRPVHAYPHGSGTAAGNCIAGGTFYNPPNPQFPAAYYGQYFFSDFTNNWIKRLNPATGAVTLFATNVPAPVDLDVGPDGNLYYLSRGANQVGRIAYSASLPPIITLQPSSQLVSVGFSATFSTSAGGEPPLSYQWQRNGVNIAGATSASYTLNNAQTTDSGARFRAVVTNARGTATSNEAVLTVTTNKPPTATISTPTSGATYTAGTTLSFSGSGSDMEDGNLPASALTWSIDFHHDTHFHPAMAETSGVASGSYSIPNQGETSPNVWYRVRLTARDSIGLTSTVTRDVMPVTRTMTFATNPAGLGLELDSAPFTPPQTVTGVVGLRRLITAPSPQLVTNRYYVFSSWSDGGAMSHTITTPSNNTTYTANFTETTRPACGSTLLSPITASSSSDEGPDLGAAKAIDGMTTTRWSSAAGDPQWIYVDLGGTRFVKRVVLNWETAASRDYALEVADSVAGPWTQIYRDTAGNGGIDDVVTQNGGTGRYLRVYSRARTTQYGVSLWELQVYGDNNRYCNPGGSGPVCGNGITETGEQCDDGNSTDNDSCRNNCVRATCSDGLQNQGETGLDCGGPCSACSTGGCTSVVLTPTAATSSSSENVDTGPAMAIDGNVGTRWSSQFTDAQWITLDLGARKKVNRIYIDWEAANARDYRIEVSDNGTSWTTLATRTMMAAGNHRIDDFAVDGAGRYVRMQGVVRNTTWGYSIWEMRVYGDNNPNCSATTPGLLSIASSTSGAFQTPPANAHDNNTSTRYTNDGNLLTATITFNLAQSASVSRIRLLMYAGSTRTYPLRISVGSTVVFNASTATNASYWETSFAAVPGNTITVTMTAPNSAGSNWLSIWEAQILGTP